MPRKLSKKEKDMKKKMPWMFEACWRCGIKGPHYDSSATMTLSCSDASYSGTFRVPMCFSCACIPHNSFPDNFRVQ